MKKEECPDNWLDAFLMLEMFLESKDNSKKQIVFLDELPWMDTPRSGFITAFEGFWNTWGCHRDNLIVIICGSATSWITDNLINNHGGLYNRLTFEMKLLPFTLGECEQYFAQEGIKLSRYDITQAYTVVLRGKENGQTVNDSRIVTSVSKVMDCKDDYEDYMGLAKLESLRFVVSNTTEAGIVLDKNDSMEGLPATYPGKLTKFLYER